MTGPSIMAYVEGAVVDSFDTASLVPDFVHNNMYGFAPGTDAVHSGMMQFNGYPTGNETIEQSLGNMGLGTSFNPEQGARCITPNGYIVCNLTDSNQAVIGAIQTSDLICANTFGVSGSGTGGSGGANILCPAAIVPICFGLYNYVVLTPTAFHKGEICIMSIPGMVNVNIGSCSETNGTVLGPGHVGTSSGTAFALAQPTTDTDAFGLYEIAMPAATLTRLGSILPSAIDATWTTIEQFGGLTYDQTDGNVLAMFHTTDSVTVSTYLVKLNSSTAAVIWAAALTNMDAYAFANMPKSVVQAGKYYYLDGDETFRTIDTATGGITTQTISVLDTPLGQISEDISNSLIVNCGWAQSGTVPTYVGTYMDTEGNHSLSTQWARFWPGVIGPIPIAIPALSAYKAWTYVLDGHTFYVLDLDTQGTFIYDFVTQEWSNFTTGTPSDPGVPNPEWNFINGWQWTDRIVGGDINTSDLWEMSPSAMLDNDVTEISHVSTGGISTRNRVFHSCDAVRVTASFGIVDDVSGTVFNLRFSDDNEKTWSEYFTITLTEGAYDTELAWRSLGSFAAPGRIFEVSDTGGLIRIDGCDAFIDGFDNDPQDQNTNKG